MSLPSLYIGGVVVGAVIVLVMDLSRGCGLREMLRDLLVLPVLWPLAVVLHMWVVFREWGNLDGPPDVH